MNGASFILAINLFVAALFALAFFLVASNNKSDKVAVWFCLAYVFGLLYIAFEFLMPSQDNPYLSYTGGFAAFYGAVSSVTIGIAKRYRQPVPWVIIGTTAVGATLANCLALNLGHASLVRMLIYQVPYAFMQAMAGWIIYKSARRHGMDKGLLALFTLSAVQFLSKPFVAQWTGGAGATAHDYIATTYALYSQSLGAVLQVATGLLMLLVLVRDMLLEITAKSETDTLSGLYNRRGFEERAMPGLTSAAQGRMPAALVACDLDRFKAINDTYGHDAGDKVIVAFATLLRAGAPAHACVGRIGGEEFAVFIPGANLATARLFAEGIRVAFASLEIEGLAEGAHCTASLGVAECAPGESLSDLRRRADAALYAAKRGGRDRVCLAPDPGLDAMPTHPLAEPQAALGR